MISCDQVDSKESDTLHEFSSLNLEMFLSKMIWLISELKLDGVGVGYYLR